MPSIDETLEVLKDGKWHDLDEVVGKFRLHDFKAGMIQQFIRRKQHRLHVHPSSIVDSFILKAPLTVKY